MPESRILILGIGNEILTDDGIGPRLVKDLSTLINRDDTDFLTACCGGLEIAELICGYEKAVLVDAIKTAGGNPGEVYFLSPDDFIETSNLSNLHDINFITALKLGKLLEHDITDKIFIIAVEILHDLEFSEKLSPVIVENYPLILSKVKTHIEELIST